MPRVRIKHQRFVLSSKSILGILTAICVLLMILTYTTDIVAMPFSFVSGYTIIPFQNGVHNVGVYLTGKAEDLKNLRAVINENNRLQEEIDQLKIENSNLIQDKYELNELRALYDLDQQYSDYEKIGARVIGKDPGNWFSVFLIDKGTDDGIEKDMNVMAGAGLVGIITEVGPNWATVRSIIDDASNVSSTVLSTGDNLMVSGDLLLMEQGRIRFSQLSDEEGKVIEGDKIVTSTISDKYLPGINIGYISSIGTDSNNLTMSGTITPVVDFDNIDIVLVIKEKKVTK